MGYTFLWEKSGFIDYRPQSNQGEEHPQSENAETPVTEKDVTDQPANLLAAYSKGGKNYIDVDYIEWLHAEAALTAMVQDGYCTSVNECEVYPNGYHRNRNPRVRTFEVSPAVSIELQGVNIAYWLFYFKIISESERERLVESRATGESKISFKQLGEVVPKITGSPSSRPPFQQEKTFITIDIKDGLVTKIFEPYQE